MAGDDTPTPLSRAGDAVLGIGALGAGAMTATPAAERVLGAQRFVHGTSQHAADSILREGLLRSHGGRAGGSSDAARNPRFLDASKGRVHVAKDAPFMRRMADAHAALAEAAHRTGGPPPAAQAIYNEALLTGNPGGGAVLGGALPYDEFHVLFERDPDLFQGAYRTNKTDIPAASLRRGSAGLRQVWDARAKDLTAYWRRNPARALRGAGLAALGTGSAAYGLSKLHDATKTAHTYGVQQAFTLFGVETPLR